MREGWPNPVLLAGGKVMGRAIVGEERSVGLGVLDYEGIITSPSPHPPEIPC